MKTMFTVLAMFLLPLSLQAMTPLSDAELSGISGQTGVSIFVDITMNIHIDCIAWGDSDGLGNSWGAYRSGSTAWQGDSTPYAEVSVMGNQVGLQLWEILQGYPSTSGVCFFPEPVSMDFVDGVPRFR